MILEEMVEDALKDKARMALLGKQITDAQKIPFTPYAVFMNATRGRIYRCESNGKFYTRLQVWLREGTKKYTIKKISMGVSKEYIPEDKPGWVRGIIVDKVKAGVLW